MPAGQEFENGKPIAYILHIPADPQFKLSFKYQPNPNDTSTAILRPKKL